MPDFQRMTAIAASVLDFEGLVLCPATPTSIGKAHGSYYQEVKGGQIFSFPLMLKHRRGLAPDLRRLWAFLGNLYVNRHRLHNPLCPFENLLVVLELQSGDRVLVAEPHEILMFMAYLDLPT